MSLRDAIWSFLTQIALAAAVTLVLLMGIEWLMPGAVLPFVDVLDWLLPITILLVIALAHGISLSKLSKIAQITIGAVIGAGLLAILAIRVENYKPSVLALLIAFGILVCTWLWAASKPDNP
ncbi:MAG: hypothetical protein PHC53_01930 [Patescibacteria group bacterium]|nr:hypothetical protein [Patescibacteria group bacterium]